MTFKTHMVLVADNDGFQTLCGIGDGCSELFFDEMPLVEYGNKKDTTCKICLRKWALEEAKLEEMDTFLLAQTQSLP